MQYTGNPSAPGVLSWAQLMDIGAKEGGAELERRVRQVRREGERRGRGQEGRGREGREGEGGWGGGEWRGRG